MIDKRAKRWASRVSTLVDVADMRVHFSALSLRVFGEDLTVAGRQANTKKGTVKPEEDGIQQTEEPVDGETECAEIPPY